VVPQQHGAPCTQRLGHRAGLLGLGDELRRLLEGADPVGEEDGVVGQHLELRLGGGEGGGVGRMPVHDGAHVGAPAVDLRVEHRLQVHVRRGRRAAVAEVELDDVVRLHLVQGHPLALYVHRRPARLAGADVAEREVGVALEGEDAAGPRHLLAERLRSRPGH